MAKEQQTFLNIKTINNFIQTHKEFFADANGKITIANCMPAKKIIGLDAIARKGECYLIMLNNKSPTNKHPSMQTYYVTDFLFVDENFQPTDFENVWRAYYALYLEETAPNINYKKSLEEYLKTHKYRTLKEQEQKSGLLSKLTKTPEEVKFENEMKNFQKAYNKERSNQEIVLTKIF